MGLFDNFSDFSMPDWATDILGGVKDVVTGQATQALGKGIANFFTPSPNGPIFKQQGPGSGLVPPNSGGSTGTGLAPSPDPFAILGGGVSYKSIRAKMVDQLGFAPRRKTVMMMLRRMGADFTMGALGIDQNDVLWLYTHRRSSSRRHFVETYMKWCRRGDSARKRLSHFASKCGTHHRSRAPSKRRQQPARLRIVKVPVSK